MFGLPPSLMVIHGGSGVPNLKRVTPVGIVPSYVGASAVVVPSTMAFVGSTPLPPSGSSVVGA